MRNLQGESSKAHLKGMRWGSKVCYLEGEVMQTSWSYGPSNPRAKTPILGKPSKSVFIGVWHKDNSYLDTSTIGNKPPTKKYWFVNKKYKDNATKSVFPSVWRWQVVENNSLVLNFPNNTYQKFCLRIMVSSSSILSLSIMPLMCWKEPHGTWQTGLWCLNVGNRICNFWKMIWPEFRYGFGCIMSLSSIGLLRGWAV
jgi:hypothetical protein